jgi:carbonic anhydrase
MSSDSDQVLDQLLQGIKGFQERYYRIAPERMKDLTEQGQNPKVLLIACSDSRVDPALLTGAGPGDIFVIRNVANLVPPYHQPGFVDGARAAIEYAVRHLEVNHIVVLGHACCGGIKALLSGLSGEGFKSDFIERWVSVATDSCSRYLLDPEGKTEITRDKLAKVDPETLLEYQNLTERAAIRGSLANLKTYPWIAERMAQGTLSLHGWWFDLESGDLWTTDPDNTSFLPVLD